MRLNSTAVKRPVANTESATDDDGYDDPPQQQSPASGTDTLATQENEEMIKDLSAKITKLETASMFILY